MQVYQPDSLCWYSFEEFPTERLNQAFFTRHGGVSPSPWAELNLGGTVGDTPGNVLENKRRAFHAFGKPIESLYDVWQVHSADVVSAHSPRPTKESHRRADAIITDRPGITLLMRFADCVPIILYDPIHHAVGLVHAGWLGTVKKAVVKTIQAMQLEFFTAPQSLIAGIGPSICARHYQVGADVVSSVKTAFGGDADDLLPSIESESHFDLWSANQLLLEQAGVRQIVVSGICTACQVKDWYSHRQEHGKTGRFGVLVALEA